MSIVKSFVNKDAFTPEEQSVVDSLWVCMKREQAERSARDRAQSLSRLPAQLTKKLEDIRAKQKAVQKPVSKEEIERRQAKVETDIAKARQLISEREERAAVCEVAKAARAARIRALVESKAEYGRVKAEMLMLLNEEFKRAPVVTVKRRREIFRPEAPDAILTEREEQRQAALRMMQSETQP